MLVITRRRHGVNEPGRLKDKSALVTGASSGLGRATAFVLAQAGADVALVARSTEELESAKEGVLKSGRRALTIPTDLAEEAPSTMVLPPERVAELIAWLAASPPEFVLTEGIVLPIEEELP
jgi:NADP-dependent 3-hydroxy acid dehydrogenase YdfG